jgi:hypothetical protein
MLTAFPKQNVAMVLANQSIGDLDRSLTSAVLGTVGTLLLLHQGREGSRLLEVLGQPRFDSRDLMSVRDHTAVIRADAADVARRSARPALAPPPRRPNDEAAIGELRRSGARRFDKPREEVEAALFERIKVLSEKSRDEPTTACFDPRLSD